MKLGIKNKEGLEITYHSPFNKRTGKKEYLPYLRFGNLDGRYVGSITHLAQIRKLIRICETYLSDSK